MDIYSRIEIELEWLNLLEKSNAEFTYSIKVLEEQLDKIDEENNEWRSRYDGQVQINDYYYRAYEDTERNLVEAKEFLKEIVRSFKDGSLIMDYSDITHETVKMLQHELNQLTFLKRQIELRNEEEAKAHNRANDKRKDALIELGFAHVPVGISQIKPKPIEVKKSSRNIGSKITSKKDIF